MEFQFLNQNSKTTTSEKMKDITSKDRKHQRENWDYSSVKSQVVIVVNPNASSVIRLRR